MQMQMIVQKLIDLAHLFQQYFGFMTKDDDVIDVAQVAPDFELMLDVLIQRIEVNIAKKLARKAADGQADIGLAMKQRFVRRYLFEQGDIATQGGLGKYWVLQNNLLCNCIQLPEGLFGIGQSCLFSFP